MATHNLLLLPGDGIGPEVAKEVEKVAAWFGKTASPPSTPSGISSAAPPMTRTRSP